MKRLCAWMLLLLLGLWAPARAERLPDSELLTYYNDSIFVGDSITGSLRTYVYGKREKDEGYMRGTFFYAVDNYTLYAASREFVQKDGATLKLLGSPTAMCRIIEYRAPKRLFILLGVNDHIGLRIEKGLGYVKRIIELIDKYAPDTVVHFFSLTPVTRAFCRKVDYQPLWDEYNAQMQTVAEENGAFYIDIATPLKGEDGYLPKANSSDNEFHLSTKGNDIWIAALLDFAQEQYDCGAWAPGE